MQFNIHKKLISWMAIFAILMAFFAPTVSQALSSNNPSNLIYQKVCSQHGNKFVPIQVPSNHSDDSALHQHGYCNFCCLSSDNPDIGLISPALRYKSLSESQQALLQGYDAPFVNYHYSLSYSPQAPPVI